MGQVFMFVSVDSDFMSSSHNLFHISGIGFGCPPGHEESRLDRVLVEQVQDLRESDFRAELSFGTRDRFVRTPTIRASNRAISVHIER